MLAGARAAAGQQLVEGRHRGLQRQLAPTPPPPRAIAGVRRDGAVPVGSSPRPRSSGPASTRSASSSPGHRPGHVEPHRRRGQPERPVGDERLAARLPRPGRSVPSREPGHPGGEVAQRRHRRATSSAARRRRRGVCSPSGPSHTKPTGVRSSRDPGSSSVHQRPGGRPAGRGVGVPVPDAATAYCRSTSSATSGSSGSVTCSWLEVAHAPHSRLADMSAAARPPHRSPRRRPVTTTHHGRDPRRRLRVAARQGRPRGARPPRGRERPHPGRHRPPRRPARGDLRRDQGPHPRDRPVGADPQPAATGTTAAPSRAASTAPAAGSRSPTRPTGPRRAPDEDCAPDQPALPGEEVLLDLDQLAEGHDFFSLGGSSVSPDTRLLAYATDTTGDERYTVRVKDLRTGELLPRRASPACSAAPPGTPTATSFFYATVDDTWRPDKVWRHRLGTAQADDELVHHETDPRLLGRRRPHPHRPVRADRVRLQDHHRGPAPRHRATPTPASGSSRERREGLEYGVEHAVHRRRGRAAGAAQPRPGPTSSSAPRRSRRPRRRTGSRCVAHDPAVRLEDVDAFAGHLVVHQRSEGLTQLRLLTLDDDGVADDYLVEFDQEIYTVGSVGQPRLRRPGGPARLRLARGAGLDLRLRRRGPRR